MLPVLPPEPLPLPATAGELVAISSPRAIAPAANATSPSPDLPFHFRNIHIPFLAKFYQLLSVACLHHPHNAVQPPCLKPDVTSLSLLPLNVLHGRNGNISSIINQVFIRFIILSFPEDTFNLGMVVERHRLLGGLGHAPFRTAIKLPARPKNSTIEEVEPRPRLESASGVPGQLALSAASM